MNSAVMFGWCLIFFTMFTTTFLRGVQNKNVAGGHKRLAFGVGFVMAMSDFLTISLVGGTAVYSALTSGNVWPVIVPAVCGGLGSAIGWVLSMVAHDRLMRRRNSEREEQKKLRKRSKQEERIRDVLRDELDDLEAKGIITINRQQ